MGIPGPSVGRRSYGYVWDSSVLTWVQQVQSAAGGGGSTQVAVSSVSGTVTIGGNSTVIQGTSPWVIGGNSSVWQGSTAWQVQVTNQTRVTNSSAADFVVAISGNSTAIIQGNSSVWQGSSAWQVQVTNSPTVGVVFAAGYMSTTAQSGNSSGLTVRPVWSSSNADQPVRAVLSSTSADNPVTCTPVAGSTWNTRTFCSSHTDFKNDAWMVDSTGTYIDGSSKYGGISTRYGLAVRSQQVAAATASGQAATAGDNTIVSSVAAKAIYVYAWTLTQLSTTANLVRWMDSTATEVWRVRVLGGSTAGMNYVTSEIAVTPPAYLFKTSVANPLVMNTTSSGVNYGVAYWQE